MSRAAVHEALSTAPALQILGLAPGATYAANAVDTPIERPFVVMRWEENTRAFGLVGSTGLTVWVHDEPGDYTRIDSMLEEIKRILTGMVHVPGPDQQIVTQIDWSGDSADLYDDGFRTNTRNASFRVVSRYQ